VGASRSGVRLRAAPRQVDCPWREALNRDQARRERVSLGKGSRGLDRLEEQSELWVGPARSHKALG
jgi:hypothetical protein